jgi:hypothetical protein
LKKEETQMPTQLEKAREYLDALEAERLTALALSERKAEEAKAHQSPAGRISSGHGDARWRDFQ